MVDMDAQFRILNEQELNIIYELFYNFTKVHKRFELSHSQKKFARLVLKSVLNNEGKSIPVEFSRQSGKTECLALIVDFLSTHYTDIVKKYNLPNMGFFNIGIYAPQKEQAKTDFDRIKEFLISDDAKIYGFKTNEFNGTTIKLRKKNGFPIDIYCFCASPTSKTESKTNNLIVLEEVQDMFDKKIDTTIIPTGAATNATIVYIGTAGYQRKRFYDLIERVPDDEKVIANCKTVIKERREMFERTNNPIYLNYEKHIKQRKREIGEDSDEFKTQYMLQWCLERGQFITYEEMEALQVHYLESDDKLFHVFGRGIKLYAGIDWGQKHDSTIFTVGTSDGKVVYWKEIIGEDYPSQIAILKEIIRERFLESLKEIRCDSTGNQDSTVDMLRYSLAGWGISVIGVNFSAQSKDFMYKNLSALMKPITMNSKIIRQPLIRIPIEDSPEKEKFIYEFCNLQKEVKAGKWHCQHPAGNFHDDYCDSMALYAMGLNPNMGVQGHRFMIA